MGVARGRYRAAAARRGAAGVRLRPADSYGAGGRFQGRGFKAVRRQLVLGQVWIFHRDGLQGWPLQTTTGVRQVPGRGCGAASLWSA